jgi:hypothetical protein
LAQGCGGTPLADPEPRFGETAKGFVVPKAFDAGIGAPLPGRTVRVATGSGLSCGALASGGIPEICPLGRLTRFGATGLPDANAAPDIAVMAPGTR